MNLPDLALQIVYGRLAWGIVVAALALAWLPGVTRRTLIAVPLASIVMMALPGEASPAYWLTLAFQYPSGLLAGCALVTLCSRWQGRTVRVLLPAAFALPIAVAGMLLYLDTFGVLALGLYHGGFSAHAAPLLGCAGVVLCAAAIMRGQAAGPALALMTGLLLYALARLPSGNLWDALLDPLVWGWAVVSLPAAAVRFATGRRAVPAIVPAPVATPAAEPVPAAAIEQLQTVRE